MSDKSTAETGIQAFFKGYKEQGIEYHKVSLESHWNEVERNLISASQVAFGKLDNEGIDGLVDLLSKTREMDMIERTTLFGEAMKSFARFASESVIKNENFRTAAYHFLALAEIIRDSMIVKIAGELGEIMIAK